MLQVVLMKFLHSCRLSAMNKIIMPAAGFVYSMLWNQISLTFPLQNWSEIKGLITLNKFQPMGQMQSTAPWNLVHGAPHTSKNLAHGAMARSKPCYAPFPLHGWLELGHAPPTPWGWAMLPSSPPYLFGARPCAHLPMGSNNIPSPCLPTPLCVADGALQHLPHMPAWIHWASLAHRRTSIPKLFISVL